MQIKITAVLFLILLNISCENSKQEKVITSNSKNTEFAKFFKIIAHENFTEIQIINPDNQKIDKKFALAKDISNLKLEKDFIPVKIPLKSIITLNGTDIGMLSKLNLTDKIVGVSNITYIYNPKLKAKFKQGSLQEINDFSQMNPETVSKLSSFISYSGFGTPPANEEKLAKLGVICLPNYDWREIHPLGKAEWIKVFGAFFDKQKQAETYFSRIKEEFLTIEKEAKKEQNSPSILSGSIIGDFWYMPSGNSFNAAMIQKAKGDFVGKDKLGTGSQTYTFEAILSLYKNTEIWINPGFSSKKLLLQANEKYKYLDAFKNNQIYCYSHNMNYFWEMSAIEPQKVLSDYYEIFHGKQGKPKTLFFYKKLTD